MEVAGKINWNLKYAGPSPLGIGKDFQEPLFLALPLFHMPSHKLHLLCKPSFQIHSLFKSSLDNSPMTLLIHHCYYFFLRTFWMHENVVYSLHYTFKYMLGTSSFWRRNLLFEVVREDVLSASVLTTTIQLHFKNDEVVTVLEYRSVLLEILELHCERQTSHLLH